MRWQNVEFSADGRWHAFPVVNVGGGRWRAGPGGILLVIHPFARTRRAVNVWRDLDPWLFPVARAGFDGDNEAAELVLLDDDNHELQRLQRLTDPQRLRDRGWRIGFPRPTP